MITPLSQPRTAYLEIYSLLHAANILSRQLTSAKQVGQELWGTKDD